MSELLTKLDIELEMLKSRVESLERNEKSLMSNWVNWTKDTKECGQKLMIALNELNKKNCDL